MPLNKTPLVAGLLLAALVMIALLASACVSAPGPTGVSPVTQPVSPTPTLYAGNGSTISAISPTGIICNCPMEPVVSVTVTPTATPNDGLCHCP